jgi:hypothetical protein
MTKMSPVNQKTYFNVYPGNCQQDPAGKILGLDWPKFSSEQRIA